MLLRRVISKALRVYNSVFGGNCSFKIGTMTALCCPDCEWLRMDGGLPKLNYIFLSEARPVALPMQPKTNIQIQSGVQCEILAQRTQCRRNSLRHIQIMYNLNKHKLLSCILQFSALFYLFVHFFAHLWLRASQSPFLSLRVRWSFAAEWDAYELCVHQPRHKYC